MEFMHPGLLAGGLFAAIPVVLHLVMRQRPKPLEFPALRFVQARRSSNRRTLNLRHLLLLALRVAAVGLLAFALARPSAHLFGWFGSVESPISAVLVFDVSPRMGYVAERKTRLAAAQEFARQLLDALPPKSEIGIVDNAAPSRVFEADPTIARERLANLKIAGRGRPLSEACEGAAELLRSAAHDRKELYVFTDLSVGAWSGHRAGDWVRRAVDAGVAKVQLVDVGAEKPENFSLGNVGLSDQMPVRNRPLIVTCSLSALGTGEKRLVRITTFDRATGAATERGVEELDLAAGETKDLDFTLGGLDVGVHQGEVRIDEPDHLPDDNVRYFTVLVRPAQRILVAAPAPPAARSTYYTQAVAGRELVVNGIAPYDVKTISYEELATAELDGFAAVLLLDPPPLADPVWQQIEGYARSGGGAAVVLGPQAKPEAFNGDAAQSVLAGKLDIQARYPDGDLYLWPDADQHLMTADFKPVKNTTPWPDFPVYRYWKLAPAEGTVLVASYNNEAAALVERPIGLGRAVTMTTPISEPADVRESDRWNFLPIGPEPWPFVVLMNGLTSYLAGREEAVNYLAQETARVRLESGKRFETYLVTRRGFDGPPLRVAADLRRNLLTVPITDEPGNYRVQAGGSEGGVERGFSVNLSADADTLRRLDPERLAALLGDAPHGVSRRFAEVKRESNPDRRGRELFPLLICLTAVVLGCEQVLANRFYRE